MFGIARCVALAIAILTAIALPVAADELRVGARAEIVMDPHFMWSGSNTSYYVQTYGYLLQLDEQAQVQPMLAESWRFLDQTTWEFNLRKGVTFHDGSPFTAEDVVATFKRVPNVPNAAGPYTGALLGIKGVEAVDPYTVRFLTDKPIPVIPHQIAQIPIIPKKIAETASTADFNTGKAAIGAGPYRFVKYIPGDQLVLERNETYWGAKPEWQKVTFKFISDDAARVAALLSGDVDVVDFVPPTDVKRLRENPQIAVHVGPSDRVIYLWMDVERDNSPFITDASGHAGIKNPFTDIRVRQAIGHAINRDVITGRVMDGLATPASELVPPGFGGYNKDIPIPAYDPDLAKRLLAEAGLKDGFGVTIHCPNDRYVNDARICQAVGQQLAQIGLKIKVETLPKSIFFPKVTEHGGQRFSLFLMGWGSSSGGEADALWQVLHSYDKTKSIGTWNLGHYSNPKVDALVDSALSTLDRQARLKIEEEAMALAMQDGAVVPLHFQSVIVATRKDLSYRVYADENTRATAVGKVKP
jgi:peptide/nickel transport system substrate-binding protein